MVNELTKDDFKKDIGIKDYCLFVKSATFQEADKIRVDILKNQEDAHNGIKLKEWFENSKLQAVKEHKIVELLKTELEAFKAVINQANENPELWDFRALTNESIGRFQKILEVKR